MESANDPAHLRYAVDVLERRPVVWEETSPEAQDALAGSIWPGGLTVDGKRYRTHPGDDLIGLVLGARELKPETPALQKRAGVSRCDPDET